MRENPFRNSSLARATEKINTYISANQIATTPSACQMLYGGSVAPNFFLNFEIMEESVRPDCSLSAQLQYFGQVLWTMKTQSGSLFAVK